MRVPGVPSLTISVLAFSASGCRDLAPPPQVTERDSAGITIVYSEAPAWGDGAGWSLGPSPRLEISTESDDPESVIYEVTGVVVLPDGRVAIANHGDSSIRMYDGDGLQLWKVGRTGDGPSEFRDLRGLVLLGDEIWAFQRLPHPMNVFDLQGQLLKTVGTPPMRGPSALRGIWADGSLIVRGRPHGSPTERVWTEFTELLRFREGRTDTLAVVPHTRRVDLGRLGQEWQALGPALSVAVSDDRVFAGFSSDWDIGVWDNSGQMSREIRRIWDPQPVTAQHQDAYREGILAMGLDDPGREGVYRELAEGMVFPEHHAAHARMIADAVGNLWVERPQTEPPWSEGIDYARVPPDRREWDVFAPNGAWLGSVALPERFRAMHIGPDLVAGVWKDELDVEHVQLWDLLKPNG